MSKHSGCGIIVFNNKLETLLVESFKGKNNCSFPKGRKNFPEETDEECAKRELKEETGLTENEVEILNFRNVLGTEQIGNGPKCHHVGYFVGMYKGDPDFKFTFDSGELKGRPYWADKTVVYEKFYGGQRRSIYDKAYQFISGYLDGKFGSESESVTVHTSTSTFKSALVHATVSEPIVTDPIKLTSGTKSWSSIVKTKF
jgi:8-oxo-dGTP pyrophosphatase MutT (NUDIX family)